MQFPDIAQESYAAEAFSHQSAYFDEKYANNLIIQYKREIVRKHLTAFLESGDQILELNAGTGEDAVYLEKKGFRIHATDISEGMLSVLMRKASLHNCQNLTSEICSFHSLKSLKLRNRFDHIFSNFAGLNCSAELRRVLTDADVLLNPGGKMTLVLMPGFCLWEFLMIFKGKFRTALRRFTGSPGTEARIDNKHFRCYYYSPSYVTRSLPKYNVLSLKGLCCIVPPSYIEDFGIKYPRTFSWLKKMEIKYSETYPWRYLGDYYIITLQKPL